MKLEEKIRLHYPLPITKLYTAVYQETDPRLQVEKLIELFEGTSRFLALIGLAGYIHHQLVDSQVEQLRPGLARPSLGHWVNLLRGTAPLLAPYQFHLLGDKYNQNRNSDVIGEVTRQLTEMLNLPPKAKRLKLDHFLTAVVEFRNKKRGHGSLPRWQAKEIVSPLENALLQWLDELTVLEQQKLVYLTQVEWKEETQFSYHGFNLNVGDAPLSFSSSGTKPLSSNRVYLFNSAGDEYLPLYPFFAFDEDFRLLYVYSELSSQDKPLLRCPFETLGGEAPYYVDVNKAIIVGLMEAPAEGESTETTVDTEVAPVETIAEASTKISDETPQLKPEPVTSSPQPDIFDTGPPQPILPQPDLPAPPAIITFDDVVRQLESRVRQVCRPQARYPVLWVLGGPCTGKTSIARAVCQQAGWRYVDFTLDSGCLDSLVGREESYRPEDFLTYIRSLGQVTTKVVVLDEIEPLLGWWSWDEQEVFFRIIARATRLKCGVALVTRLRNSQQFEKIAPGQNQIFQIPKGVEP